MDGARVAKPHAPFSLRRLSTTIPMHPTVVIFGILAVAFTVCALLPVVTSAYFGYRPGEWVAISIAAISGLVLLIACGLLTYLPHISHQLSEEERHLAMFAVLMTGVPALSIFMGTLAGYIAMGFLRSARSG